MEVVIDPQTQNKLLELLKTIMTSSANAKLNSPGFTPLKPSHSNDLVPSEFNLKLKERSSSLSAFEVTKNI